VLDYDLDDLRRRAARGESLVIGAVRRSGQERIHVGGEFGVVLK
jgi:hypothetical protein